MDPFTIVGLVASITQLVDVTTRVIRYLNGVKNAPKKRAGLEKESSALLSLLIELRDLVENTDPNDAWFSGIRPLGSVHGPLEILKHDLEALADKLKPRSKWKQAVLWTFDEQDITQILLQIERGKSSIGLALQKGHFELTRAIGKQSLEISTQVIDIAGSVREHELDKKSKKHQHVVSWLSPLKFGQRQADVLSRRQSGTGEWLLDTYLFKSLMSGQVRTLWFHGPRRILRSSKA